MSIYNTNASLLLLKQGVSQKSTSPLSCHSCIILYHGRLLVTTWELTACMQFCHSGNTQVVSLVEKGDNQTRSNLRADPWVWIRGLDTGTTTPALHLLNQSLMGSRVGPQNSY